MATAYAPLQTLDMSRAPALQPGYLVYSAKLDQEKLKCYWCSRCECCASDELSRRTVLDVYSNGLMTNVPVPCCCFCSFDNARFMYFDKFPLGTPMKVGCCTPCPFWCPHCFECCGETIGFYKSCGCPTFAFHWAYLCAGYGLCCCCALDVFVGLAPGQADIVTAQIAAAKAQFHAAGNQSPPRVVVMQGPPQPPMMMMQQQAQYSPQSQEYQQPPQQQMYVAPAPSPCQA